MNISNEREVKKREVCTSSSFMRGTGEKKWVPAKRSRRAFDTRPPISLTGNEDVLVVMMAFLQDMTFGREMGLWLFFSMYIVAKNVVPPNNASISALLSQLTNRIRIPLD